MRAFLSAPGCVIIQFDCSSIISRNTGPLGIFGNTPSCFISRPSMRGCSHHIPTSPSSSRDAANASYLAIIPCRTSSLLSSITSPSMANSIMSTSFTSSNCSAKDKISAALQRGPILCNTFEQSSLNSIASSHKGLSSVAASTTFGPPSGVTILQLMYPCNCCCSIFPSVLLRPSPLIIPRSHSSSDSPAWCAKTRISLNKIFIDMESNPLVISLVKSSAAFIILSEASASLDGLFN
mmetsp:Transcript_6783/g.8951  ORF Transcript_6783/g.8951 Transcript_6783/m.8951 type:complete len:237 (+) Transcript_6783:194-904(+)